LEREVLCFGDDAEPYQEEQVKQAIEEVEE